MLVAVAAVLAYETGLVEGAYFQREQRRSSLLLSPTVTIAGELFV